MRRAGWGFVALLSACSLLTDPAAWTGPRDGAVDGIVDASEDGALARESGAVDSSLDAPVAQNCSTPGTKKDGESCAADSECESCACVSSDAVRDGKSGGFCRRVCGSAADCAHLQDGVCWDAGSGAKVCREHSEIDGTYATKRAGESCGGSNGCAETLCRPGYEARCLAACASDDDCVEGSCKVTQPDGMCRGWNKQQSCVLSVPGFRFSACGVDEHVSSEKPCARSDECTSGVCDYRRTLSDNIYVSVRVCVDARPAISVDGTDCGACETFCWKEQCVDSCATSADCDGRICRPVCLERCEEEPARQGWATLCSPG